MSGTTIAAAISRPAASSASSAAVEADIERHGYACLPGALSRSWLDAARDAVAGYLPADDVYEVFVDRFSIGSGSCIDSLVADTELNDLLRELTASQLPRLDCEGHAVEPVLRIVTGAADGAAPLDFHYDNTVVTAVVPILIPDGGPRRSGELIVARQRRPYRRTVVGNAMDKARASRQDEAAVVSTATVIPLRPGDIYLFWGYRSFHTTMPVPAGSRRVTLVLHFGHVHRGTAMRSAKTLARAARGWRRRIAGGPRYRLVNGSR